MRRIFILFFLFLLYNTVYSQKTIIKGRVVAAATREPLSFSNIQLSGTPLVAQADFEGNFEMEINLPGDTLICSYLGFTPQKKIFTVGIEQQIVFELEVAFSESQKGAVVRYKGPNPALRIIKGAQDNQDYNNPKKLNTYQCESFTKITLALNNLKTNSKFKSIAKKFGPLFDTISYISEDKNRRVLPIFISESVSDYYHENNPKRSYEYIKATQVKGVGVEDGTFLGQMLGNTFQQYNFYDNTLNILDKYFASPISMQAFTFYDYKIVHVDKSKPLRIFQIQVKPKNPLDLVFTGFVWIEDSTFQLTKLALEVSNKANLNFIEKLKIVQELDSTDAGIRLVSKNRVVVDISELSDNTPGMVAIFTTSNKKILTNKKYPPRFFDRPLVMADDALHKNEEYWLNNRHEKQSAEEKRIFSKIDTLTNLPTVKTYVELVNVIVEGYKSIGKLDWGPYAFLYGYNLLEGSKFRLGFKTNIKFSRKWIIDTYGAYGIKDKLFKYSFSLEYIINRKRWALAGAKIREDVEQLGITDNDYGYNNLFTALSVSGSTRLNRAVEHKAWIATDIISGLRIRATFAQKHYNFVPINLFRFAYLPDVSDTFTKKHSFDNTSVTFDLRYAPREHFLINDNERLWVERNGIVLRAVYTRGFKGVLNGEFNYDKLLLGVEYGLNLGFWGKTEIILTGTKIFQAVPYPLLNVHRGNQSVFYSLGAYNQMQFFEFVTDQAAALNAEHHFNGALFNRIPLMKKLKWREVLSVKSVYGTISDKNIQLIPEYNEFGEKVTEFKSMNREPYIELGYGVENIFKCIRIDFIHRITHLGGEGVRPFGIKGSFSITF